MSEVCDPCEQRDEQNIGFTGLMFNSPAGSWQLTREHLGEEPWVPQHVKSRGDPFWEAEKEQPAWQRGPRESGPIVAEEGKSSKNPTTACQLPAPFLTESPSPPAWITTGVPSRVSLPPPSFPQSISTQQSEQRSYHLSQITALLCSRTISGSPFHSK